MLDNEIIAITDIISNGEFLTEQEERKMLAFAGDEYTFCVLKEKLEDKSLDEIYEKYKSNKQLLGDVEFCLYEDDVFDADLSHGEPYLFLKAVRKKEETLLLSKYYELGLDKNIENMNQFFEYARQVIHYKNIDISNVYEKISCLDKEKRERETFTKKLRKMTTKEIDRMIRKMSGFEKNYFESLIGIIMAEDKAQNLFIEIENQKNGGGQQRS